MSLQRPPPSSLAGSLSRRAFLGGLAALGIACDPPARPAPDASAAQAKPKPPVGSAPTIVAAASASAVPEARGVVEAVETKVVHFERSEGGPQQAVIVIPAWRGPDERFPLLVALGGMGETKRGRNAASWAWMKDYWLDRAFRRLRSPPLTAEDFEGFVTDERLAELNASLKQRPFRGLCVACPATPDLLNDPEVDAGEVGSLDNAVTFARFVAKNLLPRVRAEAPVIPEPGATGIDGISLGGRLAVLVALARKHDFAAVGSMQGAFEPDEVHEVAARLVARKVRFKLRLLTSEKDPFRPALADLDKSLTRKHFDHGHLVLPGPHDYPFNRGPAALEMLLWHDRVLRGEEG